MDTRKIENKSLLLGNNDFETGILVIPAGETIPAGAFLARRGDGKFYIVNDTGNEKPVAVNPVELKNSGSASADVAFRALVGGRVRFDMLSVGGQPISDVQADMIRFCGFIPQKVTDISWVE